MTKDALSRRKFLQLSAGVAGAAAVPGVAFAKVEEPEHAQVIVVGGGLAGLTAARRLTQGAIDSLLVLESRDRVGGRTVNLPIAGGYELDGGAEWIGPTQDRIAALARELDVGTFPAYYDGDTTYDIEGEISRGLLPDLALKEGFDFVRAAWKLDWKSRKLPLGSPWEHPYAADWDRETLGEWLTENATTSFTRSVFKLITRAIMSGYPERISLLWFLHYLRSAGGLLPLILNDGGAQDTRFHGGSQLLSIKMAKELGSRLRLNQPVREIAELPDGKLRVNTWDRSYTADRVIVAMMPSDTMRIRFTPELPKERMVLAEGWARLPRLPIVKAAVIYPKPFWRDEGLNGSMQSDAAPIQLVFDNSPPDASIGILSCFLSPTEAPHLADRKSRERGIVKELVRYFGPSAAKPSGYVEKDWAADPWATGCITPLTPGILSVGGPALRKPVGRIHWAGTETSDEWVGFMDGAVRSGERVAEEVWEALRST